MCKSLVIIVCEGGPCALKQVQPISVFPTFLRLFLYPSLCLFLYAPCKMCQEDANYQYMFLFSLFLNICICPSPSTRTCLSVFISIFPSDCLCCLTCLSVCMGDVLSNRPVTQIPQCTSLLFHNAPFCNRNVHVCAHFCYKMVHCRICMMHCGICEMGLFRFHSFALDTKLCCFVSGYSFLCGIDLISKSHNSPIPYVTVYHSEQRYAHFCSEWCIVVYGTGALWDLWDWFIGSWRTWFRILPPQRNSPAVPHFRSKSLRCVCTKYELIYKYISITLRSSRIQ